jgi:hypothetical protein
MQMDGFIEGHAYAIATPLTLTCMTFADGIDFMARLAATLTRVGLGRSPALSVRFFIGFIGTRCGSSLNAPFSLDLCLIRLQLCVLNLQGFRGLYRGVSVNYLRVTPMISISFTTYDLLKILFQFDPSHSMV